MVHRVNGLCSVIIPTFNRKSNLSRIIEPLLADPSTGEIIIVIDGSNDGTLEFLEEWASRENRIRSINQEKTGSRVAMQAGLESAQFDIVVLLDDDVEAGPDHISGHAQFHANTDGLVVLGYMPTVLPHPRSPGQAATFLYAKAYEEMCSFYERDARNILTHLWGGNVSLLRSTALSIGMFDELPLLRHADMSFGLRCKEAGLVGVFDRTLTSKHLHSRTIKKFAQESWTDGEALVLIARKYPNQVSEVEPVNSVPGALVPVLQLLTMPAAEPFVSFALTKIIVISGRMKMWGVETSTARVLRLIKVSAGWRHECRSGGSPQSRG